MRFERFQGRSGDVTSYHLFPDRHSCRHHGAATSIWAKAILTYCQSAIKTIIFDITATIRREGRYGQCARPGPAELPPAPWLSRWFTPHRGRKQMFRRTFLARAFPAQNHATPSRNWSAIHPLSRALICGSRRRIRPSASNSTLLSSKRRCDRKPSTSTVACERLAVFRRRSRPPVRLRRLCRHGRAVAFCKPISANNHYGACD